MPDRVKKAVNYAASHNPTKFFKTITDQLNNLVADRLEAKRQEVVNATFNTEKWMPYDLEYEYQNYHRPTKKDKDRARRIEKSEQRARQRHRSSVGKKILKVLPKRAES